jgi:hypothetical protein
VKGEFSHVHQRVWASLTTLNKDVPFLLLVIVRACNPSTQDAGARDCQVGGQPGLHSQDLSQSKKRKEKKEMFSSQSWKLESPRVWYQHLVSALLLYHNMAEGSTWTKRKGAHFYKKASPKELIY